MSRQMVVRVSLMGAMALVLVTQYQNCAKSGATAGEDSSGSTSAIQASLNTSTNSGSGGTVHLVDPVNQSQFAVSFVDTTALIIQPSVATFGLDGLCNTSENGAQLRWRLIDITGNQAGTDLVTCTSGGFHIDVPVTNVVCGNVYTVTAQLATGTAGTISFTRSCVPTVMIVDDTQTTTSLQCFFESTDSSDASCVDDCYHSGKLQSSQATDISHCTGP
jgi:hypothetical protein